MPWKLEFLTWSNAQSVQFFSGPCVLAFARYFWSVLADYSSLKQNGIHLVHLIPEKIQNKNSTVEFPPIKDTIQYSLLCIVGLLLTRPISVIWLCYRIGGISIGEVFTFGKVEDLLADLWPFGTSGKGALEGSRLFSGAMSLPPSSYSTWSIVRFIG